MRLKSIVILVVGLLLTTACGDSITGRYADSDGVTQYTFSRNGAVTILVLGAEVDAEYRVDGDKVLVSSAQGTVVLTQRDGNLIGPMGLHLERISD